MHLIRKRCGRALPISIEHLESRVLLSGVHFQTVSKPLLTAAQAAFARIIAPRRNRSGHATPIAVVESKVIPNATAPSASAFTPAQIRKAYAFDQVNFNGIVGDGTGQTIAIVDAFDDPNIAGDLAAFDTQFGLAPPPSFTKVAQDGTTNYPPSAAGTSWDIEESLDVEWAHAAAPGANIILVESTDDSYTNLIQFAASWAGAHASVVSMSFGGSEFSGETSLDRYLVHSSTTFVASTGDAGAPAEYPSTDPGVVAVGGTSLMLNAAGGYGSESGWSGGGGGISSIEARPSYQNGIVTQSDSFRTAPDLSADADPQTGVAVYDSFDFNGSPWIKVGGTSLSAPLMAGMFAIADQGRATIGLGTLDGPSQTLPLLYQMPSTNFHDVLTGNNANASSTQPGFNAGPGYDLVTGRGSPIVNLVVYALMGTGNVSGTVYQDNNSNGQIDGTDAGLPGSIVYLDVNNDGQFETGTTTTGSNTTAVPITDNNATGVSSSITLSGTTNLISNISVTLSITHPHDSDLNLYLIAPDGTQMLLAASLPGVNFTNTTFSDQAATSISAGAAPFTGTFRPIDALADFNGKSANGTWKLRVADTVTGRTGTLKSWTLNVATGVADVYTTTANASGAYSFSALPLGVAYNVREVVPAGYVQTTPVAGTALATNPLFTSLTSQNFGNFNTIFNTSSDTDSYFVTVDPTDTFLQISSGTSATATPKWQIALTQLPSLTFNLLGQNNVVVFDFTNGSPLPAGNVTLNATANSNDELRLFGQNPAQVFTMTDTQIGPASGGAIVFQNLPTLTLANSITNYSGSLNTIQNLNINAGETFNWN